MFDYTTETIKYMDPNVIHCAISLSNTHTENFSSKNNIRQRGAIKSWPLSANIRDGRFSYKMVADMTHGHIRERFPIVQ